MTARASATARARRRWSAALGPDPREHALLAVAEHRPRRVLDIGSGDGEFAEWCARRLTVEVVVVDQSAWLGQTDAMGLPREDAGFDVVVTGEVLPAVQELDVVLADLARVLRPGGRLVALSASERYLEPLLAPWPFPFSAEQAPGVLEPALRDGRAARRRERRRVPDARRRARLPRGDRRAGGRRRGDASRAVPRHRP